MGIFSAVVERFMGAMFCALVLSQIFFKAQDGKTLGEFMLRVHKTVQRWIDFQPENAVLF
ncbi:Uncharacterised protein [Legionella feeleii]|uniref:Uncharacterized protein n=1 Tax=Legionella feeleii TaxID=453 RepID=A0A378IQD9_9GAMM|nr:Uncharacterised protein [Legionella feeleii]